MCSIVRRQASRACVMLWVVIFWETSGPGSQMDVSLICCTYLNTDVYQTQRPSWRWHSLMDNVSHHSARREQLWDLQEQDVWSS